MKGVGCYNDWTYYASPPSNLSAFAAPFSVNRPNLNDASAPFVDLPESGVDAAVPQIHFPVHPRSYGYDLFSQLDSTPSSEPYVCSAGYQLNLSSSQLPHSNTLNLPSKDAFYNDQCSNTTEPSSLVDAQSYYASYVLPHQIHDPNPSLATNHWSLPSGVASLGGSSHGDYANAPTHMGFAPRSNGLWVPTVEFNRGKGKQVGVESSLSSNQTLIGSAFKERMNQGYQDPRDSNDGEVSNMIDWEKHSFPVIADQLDDKSCWWGTIKPSVEFSSTSFTGSPSVSLGTHHDEAPVADSGNHQSSYSGSYGKNLRQHDEPSRVDTVSSTPLTGLVTGLNIGNTIADGDLGNNSFYNIEGAYHMPSLGTAGCFDSDHLRMHLERNEPSSSNNAVISDKSSRDLVEYLLKERHGFQNPQASLDNLSLRLSAVEDVSSVEKSFESPDRCNPAVDSPCWKGAPSVHFSQYEASKPLPPEYVHKYEECFGSVIHESRNFLLATDNNVRKSFENSNTCLAHNGILSQETDLAGSPRKFSVTKFASEDFSSDAAVNAGPHQSEPSCDCGLQYLGDVTESKESSVSPDKPAYDCESGISCTGFPVTDENILMFQEQHISCIGGVDAGFNVNKCLEDGTSNVTEHALSSSLSSVVDKPTTPEKSAGEVTTQKLNVQMLVDTMLNLSELLVFHCSNGACELKERDQDVLKNVITNLNTCALKNAEQIAPSQECIFTQPETSKCTGEPCELEQNGGFARAELTKVEPLSYENLRVQDARNLHFRSEKPQLKLSDSITPRCDAEMTKEDNMTKALKRILSENFHDDEGEEPQTELYKNLWLEAEAALCSVSYRARYNQMKIEMEKYSYKEREMEEQPKPEVVPSLRKSQSSVIKFPIRPRPDSCQVLPISKVTDLKFSADLSESHSSATKVHIHLNPDSSQDLPVLKATNLKDPSGSKFSADLNKSTLTPEAKDSQDLDSCIQDSTISGTTKEAGDNEASVMARFHVLKTRVDKYQEEPSEIPDKFEPRGGENQNLVNLCQDSPIPGKIKSDYEASVMARFCILKSRIEDSSSLCSEGELLDDTKNASEGKSFDVHVNPSMVHLSSYTAVDKSIPKEFHRDLEDTREIQPWGTHECGNQTPIYYSDGLASDWEHVEKRSL